jgi:hypothetical protein
MIGAIMGVGSGKSFSSVGILSADRPLEICSEISAFLMATHPWQMVNHPEEDSIQIPPPNHQVVHIYCGPG